MATGNWNNTDGLYLKYGTSKAVPATAGDFVSPGGLRVIELKIADLTTLTTTAAIQDDNVYVPTNCIIEQVEVIADTAATSGGSATLNIGLMKDDRSTTISDTALISAAALTTIDGTGEKTTYVLGTSGAGTKIGTTIGSDRGYITAKYGTAAFTAGAVTVRILYRGTGTITQ